jgi:hypothetical protein
VGISSKTMRIVLMVIGVVLVAYLTLMVMVSPDVSATGEGSGIEASNGKSSQGESSQGESSNAKDSSGEILHPNGDVIRKEQFKQHK